MVNNEGGGSNTKGQTNGHKLHILVVEDDPDLLRLSVKILKYKGFIVIAASDGAQAMDVLSSDLPIGLLFTDVVLPGPMNGVKIAREARRLRPGIKVLLTSGFTQDVDFAETDLGDDTILLQKPYRQKELLQQIGSMLD